LLDHPNLTNLLERARRRLFGQLASDKTALALVIGMGGAILLLLVGTQILDWYWPVLLVAGSLALGIYRLQKNLPSRYKLAQQIDSRLDLADSLSTAVHFAEHTEPGREAICQAQAREAELVAQRVDIRAALPSSRSRYLLPATGLVLVAFGLFALRYAVTGTMSLEPSLLKMAYDSFFGTPPQQIAKDQAKHLNAVPQIFNPGGPETPATAQDQQVNDLLDPNNSSDPQNPTTADGDKQASDKNGDQKGDSDKQGDDKSNVKDSKQGDEGKQGDKESKDGQQKDGKQDQSGDSSKEGSMMDKLRDALANMLNKMKPGSSGEKSENAKNEPKDGPKDGKDKGDQGDKQKQDSQDSSTEASSSSKGAEQNKADQAKASEQSGKASSPDAMSGAGAKDGEKSIREAKALEAMGQISEILGKRSETVTGQVQVEVGSTKQQIKTAFTDRQAVHAESGGEIHRDEVPLMFQPFVERYFEEIRKAPHAVKPASGGASKSPKKTG
jgi:hypothetical protein